MENFANFYSMSFSYSIKAMQTLSTNTCLYQKVQSNLWCRLCYVCALFICIRQFHQSRIFLWFLRDSFNFPTEFLWSYTHWAFTRMFLALRETQICCRKGEMKGRSLPPYMNLFDSFIQELKILNAQFQGSKVTWRGARIYRVILSVNIDKWVVGKLCFDKRNFGWWEYDYGVNYLPNKAKFIRGFKKFYNGLSDLLDQGELQNNRP